MQSVADNIFNFKNNLLFYDYLKQLMVGSLFYIVVGEAGVLHIIFVLFCKDIIRSCDFCKIIPDRMLLINW